MPRKEVHLVKEIVFAVLAALMVALCGCTADQSAQALSAAKAACQADAVVQPIAAVGVGVAVPAGAPAVALDQDVVHPAVVAGCAGLK